MSKSTRKTDNIFSNKYNNSTFSTPCTNIQINNIQTIASNFIDQHLEQHTSYKNINDVLKSRAKQYPEKVIYRKYSEKDDHKKSLTYRELYQQVTQLSQLLLTQTKAGERALLIYTSGFDFIPAFLACLTAKIIAAPIYAPKHKRNLDTTHALIKNCTPSIILTTQDFLDKNISKMPASSPLSSLKTICSDQPIKSNKKTTELPSVNEDTLAFLQYTSGSTSDPKGVMISHKNIIHNLKLIQTATELNDKSKIVTWLPHFHDMGLITGLLQSIYSNAETLIMSPADFIQNPLKWLQAISSFKGTHSGAPNFGFKHCVDKIKQDDLKTLDLRSWKVAFNGSEPIQKEILDSFCDTFSQCGFREESLMPCYGLAESTVGVCWTSLYKKPKSKVKLINKKRKIIVGLGTPQPDVKICIVKPDTNQKLGANEYGEIWISSDSVSQGYYNDPVNTNKTFNAYTSEKNDGPYLRTGDIGFRDDKGELYVTGRIKEILIVNGKNYYPYDIEYAIYKAHPALHFNGTAAIERDNKVILVSEIDRQHIKKANFDDIIAAILKTFSTEISLTPEKINLIKPHKLPKTTSGKIQRTRVYDYILNNPDDSCYTWSKTTNYDGSYDHHQEKRAPKNDIERFLIMQLKIITNSDMIYPDDNLYALGVDSIQMTDITFRIESEFSIQLNLDDLSTINTISELSKIIEEKQLEKMDSIDINTLNDYMIDFNLTENNKTTVPLDV